MKLYGTVQIVTVEMLEGSAIDLDSIVREDAIQHAARNGYRATTEPRITWHELTEDDITHDLLAQRAAGIEDPHVTYRAGDWKVITRFEVSNARREI